MTIKIADQFEVLTNAPIDDRMVVESYIDMLSIDNAVRYPGMIVYVIDEDSRYILDLNDTFNKLFQTIYDNDPNGLFVTTDFKVAVTNSMTTDDLPEGITNLYFTDATLGNTLIRQQFIYTAYIVPPGGTVTENYNITTNFQVMRINASHKCRVRIYGTENGRYNDINRNVGVAPDPIDSVFIDFVIPVANTDYLITPCEFVFSQSDSQYSQIYFSTTNNEITQEDITVEITYVNFGKVQLPV